MTTRRTDDPDSKDRDDYSEDRPDSTGNGSGKESFVQRIGLTGLLGAAAALITAVAALISAFNSRSGHAPDAPPAAIVPFNLSDYW